MLERPPGGTTIRLPAGLTGASSGPMTGHTERALHEVMGHYLDSGLITVKVRSWAKSEGGKVPHTDVACVQVVHVNLV